MPPLLLREILRVFLNTLAPEGNYPIEDWQNFGLPIQMQLSEKRKTFSQFFVPFLESTSNFKQFEKKMMVVTNVFPKLQTVNKFVRPPCEKPRFGTRFDSQHVKVSQKLVKSL